MAIRCDDYCNDDIKKVVPLVNLLAPFSFKESIIKIFDQ